MVTTLHSNYFKYFSAVLLYVFKLWYLALLFELSRPGCNSQIEAKKSTATFHSICAFRKINNLQLSFCKHAEVDLQDWPWKLLISFLLLNILKFSKSQKCVRLFHSVLNWHCMSMLQYLFWNLLPFTLFHDCIYPDAIVLSPPIKKQIVNRCLSLPRHFVKTPTCAM